LAPGVSLKMALAAVPFVSLFGFWTVLGAGRWVPMFLAAAILLPPLPLALGNAGPHPALLLAGLGVIAGCLRASQWRISGEWPNVVFAGYPAVLLLSVSFAAAYSGVEIAALSFARVLLFGIGPYIYFYIVHGPGIGEAWRQLHAIFWVAAAAAGFACMDFYFQFPAPAGFGPQFVWLDSGVYRRAQGLFYEASTLGNFCVFLLILVALLLARLPNRLGVSRIAIVGAGGLFAVTLMLSYSRASVVNLCVGLAVLLWLERRRIRWGWVLAGLPVSVFAAWVVAARFFPEFLAAYRYRLLGSFEHLSAASWGTLSGRMESWRLIVDFLAEHPWHLIFGVGYKTLAYSEFTGARVIADNAYLSALAETGVMGLFAMLGLNLAILTLARRATRSPVMEARFFGAWVLCFWAGQMVQMLSGDLLTYWRVLPLYFWALGIAVRYSEPKKCES